MNEQNTNLNDYYNKKIDDILAIINAIDILIRFDDFKNWLLEIHQIKDYLDIIPGYKFTFDILTRRLHNEISTNNSLGLKVDRIFERSDFSGHTIIDALPDSSEKVILLKEIRHYVKPILESNNLIQLETSLKVFKNEVLDPFLKLKDISHLNSAYSIPTLDLAIKYSTMNEVFVFLNDTSRNGVPHGYPTPNLDNILWDTSSRDLRTQLNSYFLGYKYSVQFIWFKLMSNRFDYPAVIHLHESNSWDEFNYYYSAIQKEIIDPLEHEYKINLGMAPIILVDPNAKTVLNSLLRPTLKSTYKPNRLEELEQLFQWYPIELLDSSRKTLFNGLPALKSLLYGSVEIKRKNGIDEKTQVIKLTHPESQGRHTYSYAILMETYGMISDASGWLLFFGCCYDHTGTGISKKLQIESLIDEFKYKNLITLVEKMYLQIYFSN
jgi:hypothetical protein